MADDSDGPPTAADDSDGPPTAADDSDGSRADAQDGDDGRSLLRRLFQWFLDVLELVLDLF